MNLIKCVSCPAESRTFTAGKTYMVVPGLGTLVDVFDNLGCKKSMSPTDLRFIVVNDWEPGMYRTPRTLWAHFEEES